jgi:hypothetical protein
MSSMSDRVFSDQLDCPFADDDDERSPDSDLDWAITIGQHLSFGFATVFVIRAIASLLG